MLSHNFAKKLVLKLFVIVSVSDMGRKKLPEGERLAGKDRTKKWEEKQKREKGEDAFRRDTNKKKRESARKRKEEEGPEYKARRKYNSKKAYQRAL